MYIAMHLVQTCMNNYLQQVPADGLPLSVLVGGEDDLVALGGGLLQAVDDGLLLGVLYVKRFKTILLVSCNVQGRGHTVQSVWARGVDERDCDGLSRQTTRFGSCLIPTSRLGSLWLNYQQAGTGKRGPNKKPPRRQLLHTYGLSFPSTTDSSPRPPRQCPSPWSSLSAPGERPSSC